MKESELPVPSKEVLEFYKKEATDLENLQAIKGVYPSMPMLSMIAGAPKGGKTYPFQKEKMPVQEYPKRDNITSWFSGLLYANVDFYGNKLDNKNMYFEWQVAGGEPCKAMTKHNDFENYFYIVVDESNPIRGWDISYCMFNGNQFISLQAQPNYSKFRWLQFPKKDFDFKDVVAWGE